MAQGLVIASKAAEDNGVTHQRPRLRNGIRAKPLERFFEAFFTTKNEGLGLGLSISRTIVAAHGGKLWANANPDHGATFQFTLPRMAGGAV